MLRKKRLVVPFDPVTTFPTEQDDQLTTEKSLKIQSGPGVTMTESSTPKSKRYRALWRRAFIKIKLDRALKRVGDDILLYGTQNELLDQNMQYKPNIDELIDKKAKKQEKFRHLTTNLSDTTTYTCLVVPGSTIKVVWSCVLSVLLAFTAVIMPWRIAFDEVNFWDGWATFELLVDLLFFVDVCLNFFTAIVLENGSMITNHWQIARSYLRTWFIVDFTASIPFSLIEFETGLENSNNGKYNSLVRLLRLPRLYKLCRVVRVLRMFKSTAYSQTSDKIEEFLQINSRKSPIQVCGNCPSSWYLYASASMWSVVCGSS